VHDQDRARPKSCATRSWAVDLVAHAQAHAHDHSHAHDHDHDHDHDHGCYALGVAYRTAATPDEHLACVLCDRNHRQVRQLIAGRSGAVCSDCIRQSLEVLEGRSPDPLEIAREAVDRSLDALPQGARFAMSGPVVRAALALAEGDPTTTRRIAQQAQRIGNPEAALDALQLLPEGELTNAERVALSASYSSLGDYERGLAVLEGVRGDDPNDLVLVVINRAAALLGIARSQGGAPDEAQLERELLRAKELLVASFPADDPRHGAYLPPLETNLAEIAIRSGRAAEALTLLRRMEKVNGGLSATARWFLGDALAALGEEKKAREEWERALASAHPDSRTAAELRDILAAPESAR
jgi:tetratricopeptide (TPR) repeat protein